MRVGCPPRLVDRLVDALHEFVTGEFDRSWGLDVIHDLLLEIERAGYDINNRRCNMITNGTVKFNRRVRTGDFEHKDAVVELTFSVPEGSSSEPILAHVTDTAVRHALAMVGEHGPDKPLVQDPTVPAALVSAAPSTAANVITSPAGSTAPALVGSTEAPAAPVVSQPTIVAQPPPALVAPVAPTPGNGADPTLIGAPAATGPASPALVSTAPDAPITDADLVKAVEGAVQRMYAKAQTEEQKGLVPVTLAKLIVSHLEPGFEPPPKVQKIQPARRAAALAELNAL